MNDKRGIENNKGNVVLPCGITWVSVETRLPEIDKLVICAMYQTSMGGTKRIASAIGKVNKNGRFNCAMDWVGVDYWAELPEPPCC
jgi:hypothetical protein